MKNFSFVLVFFFLNILGTFLQCLNMRSTATKNKNLEKPLLVSGWALDTHLQKLNSLTEPWYKLPL